MPYRIQRTTQGRAIAVWKEDNRRLGLDHLNRAFDRVNREMRITINQWDPVFNLGDPRIARWYR